MHIIFTIANDSYVPYFNWFARKSINFPDVRFSFLCFYKERPRMIEDMKAFGCDVYWVKYNEDKRKLGILRSIPKVYALLKKIKPDIVHCHLFDDAIMSLFSAKLAGVKVRVITKGDASYHYYYAPKWMPFDKLNNSLATHIVALSGENKEFVVNKEKAHPTKVFTIHHGIPKEDYLVKNDSKVIEIKKKYNLDGKFVFGSVGRLEQNKGMMDIVKAAIVLKEKGHEFKLIIVGEGKQEKELLQLVKENDLESFVCLAGWFDEKDIPSLYECLDVYVHASHFETFGFVIAEAMMHGLPIVATKSTGAAKDSIEHKENGYLFDFGDIDDLCKGMLYFNKSLPPKLKQENVKRALDMFEFDVMWNNHLLLYKKALS